MSATQSITRNLLTAAAGAGAGAAIATWLVGRSRRPGSSLAAADPPADLPPARVVALDGHGEMFFRDQPGPAEGPPVVLVHGWVATADLNWFTTYAALRDVGRTIAPDHRGHGRGARHSQPYRLADVADDIAALIRREVGRPVIVVGYSMGGPITQLLWQRHPDVVAGMVFCATASHFRFSEITSIAWRMMAVYQLGTRLLPRSWLEAALQAQTSGIIPAWISMPLSPGLIELAPLLPWAVGELARGNAEDLAEAGRELGRFDSRGWIGGVDVPTAVLVTTHDRMVPPSAQWELAALLGDPLIIEIDGDHDATVAQPGEFNAALLTAIDHLTSRAHGNR